MEELEMKFQRCENCMHTQINLAEIA